MLLPHYKRKEFFFLNFFAKGRFHFMGILKWRTKHQWSIYAINKLIKINIQIINIKYNNMHQELKYIKMKCAMIVKKNQHIFMLLVNV